jgi:chromosome segregation ATPase
MELAWKEADARVHVMERKLETHCKSATEIEEVLDKQAQAWVAFVGNVLEADKALSIRKAGALAAYEKSREARDEAERLYSVALTDVNKRLGDDLARMREQRELIAGHETVLDRIARELPAEIRAVSEEQQRLRSHITDMTREQGRLLKEAQDSVQAVETKLNELERDKAATEAARKKAADLKAGLERSVSLLRSLQEQLSEASKAAADAATAARNERSAVLQGLSTAWGQIDTLLARDGMALSSDETTHGGEAARLRELSGRLSQVAERLSAIARAPVAGGHTPFDPPVRQRGFARWFRGGRRS